MLVIAFFYTEHIRWIALAVAAVSLLLLALVVRAGVRHPVVWLILVAGVWLAILRSGVHATVAGILVALVVPVRPRLSPAEFLSTVGGAYDALRGTTLTRESVLADEAQLHALATLDDAATDMRPPGLVLERFLHPIQALLILPLFALVNAGVAFGGGRVARHCAIPSPSASSPASCSARWWGSRCSAASRSRRARRGCRRA